MTRLSGPQLHINYSPELDLCLTCTKTQHQADGVEYCFEVQPASDIPVTTSSFTPATQALGSFR